MQFSIFLSEFTCLKKWTVPLSNFFFQNCRTVFSYRTFVPYSYGFMSVYAPTNARLRSAFWSDIVMHCETDLQ